MQSRILHFCSFRHCSFSLSDFVRVVQTASGKRYRRQYNPNSWSSSILTIRANILCLGMSYPSVDKAMQERQPGSKVCIQHTEPSVEQAIELVRRRILSTIDGRDYARIKALEANNDMLAYAVSKEQGGPYEPKRHLNADFNSRTFLEQMKNQWGAGYGRKPIMFKQVRRNHFPWNHYLLIRHVHNR